MNSYQFNVGSNSVVGQLSWNANGTPGGLAINDALNSSNTQACAYSHDDLARISVNDCGGDLLENPGFESGNTDWSLGTVFSIADNSANAQSGSWYLSGTSTSDAWAIATATNGSNWIPVTPGEVLNYGGWIQRIAGTGSLDWSCAIVNASHTVVAWCNPAVNGDGSGGTEWEFYSAQTTVPSSAAYVEFFAEIHCCGESDQSLTSGYFDSAFFEGGKVWSQTFSFDPFGNIQKTGNNGGISFQPTYNQSTNHYSTLPVGTPSYDANGNVLSDGFHNYTWDADGNPVTIGSIGVTYDALDRMVEQHAAGVYTQIVYGADGRKLALMNGQALVTGFGPLSAGDTAVYTTGPTLSRYRRADWLGSSRLSSTPTQTLFYDGAYAPYGENYAETGTTDRNFTGQNQDTMSDLYDFLYREYHPIQGRWISPDPAGMAAVDATNPQTWNRYAYVANNPLALTDPLGLCEQYNYT